jgi:hypothetical protein
MIVFRTFITYTKGWSALTVIARGGRDIDLVLITKAGKVSIIELTLKLRITHITFYM